MTNLHSCDCLHSRDCSSESAKLSALPRPFQRPLHRPLLLPAAATRAFLALTFAFALTLTLALALAPGFTTAAFGQPIPSTGGSGTLTVSTTYDGNGTSSAGQISLSPGVSGTVVADGADVTFTRLYTTGSGGAVFLDANSHLVLSGINGGSFLFDSNTAALQGAALYLGTGASASIDHATFTNNRSTNNTGGVIYLWISSTLSLTNVLFVSNTVPSNMINANGNATGASTLFVASSTFQNNTATGAAGGSVYVSNAASSNASFTDVLFDHNTTSQNTANGGAFSVTGNKTVLNFTNVTFNNNSVTATNTGTTGHGGVMSTNVFANVANAPVINFTNASFTGNTASTLGGAIYFSNGTLALNVTAGTSALIAGNLSGLVTGASTPNFIYFDNDVATTVTINTAAADSNLDMLDPMTSNAAGAATLTITKTGDGAWNLGGNNTLSSAAAANAVTLNINQGALHLYRAGANAETDTTGAYTAATAGAGNLTLAGAGAAFTLAATNAATLSAGGGNTISAPTITLGAGANLALDLDFFANGANAGANLLTLNATTALATGGNWAQNLDLLHLADLTATAGPNDTFNLIALTGAGVTSANAFTLDSFGGLAAPTGYQWQYGNGGLLLQLVYVGGGNNVLLWNGAAGGAGANLWSDANWLAAGAPVTFTKGDIINLADNTPALDAASSTINIDPAVGAGGATIAGMYVSGTGSYTITGAAPIIATTTIGTLSGSGAATGQLILGAKAADNGDSFTADATTAYTGTLTLSNTTNTFQGGILINSGALAGNAANLGSGTGGITIDTGTLIFDQDAANGTYSSTIRSAPTAAVGAGALVKTGTGRLTLNVDDSAFTGATDINEGTLSLAAAGVLGGAIRVNANAMLGGSGTAAGNVTVNNSGTLNVTAAPLTILGDLTLNEGAILNYAALSTDPAASTLQLGGTLIQTGASTINLGVVALNTGSYSLINATAANGLAGFASDLFDVTFQGTSLTYGANYDFTTDPSGVLWLDILFVPLGRNNVLTWSGAAGDNLWHTSQNWTALGAPIDFTQGDIVNLTGAETPLATPATSTTIALTDSATTAAIYVSGNTSYTITGTNAGGAGAGAASALVTSTDAADTALAGTPAGTGKLVLGKTAPDAATATVTAFTGTLDLTALTAPDSFAAGVEINSGALRVATTGQLGTTLSKLAFTGAAANASAGAAGTLFVAGDLLFDATTLADPAANRLVLTASTAGAITLEAGKTLTIANSFTSTSTAISANGAAIYLAAGANLTLDAGAGAWYVFTSNSAAGNGGAIQNNGGNLTLTSATFANNLASNNSGAIQNSGTLTLSNVYFLSNTANLIAGGSNYTSGAITNSANSDGVSTSKLTITNAYFEANSAYNGGAVTNPSGSGLTTTTITSATFKNNTATFNGGAVQAAGGTTYIADSYFTGNFAGNLGGALLLNATAQVTLLNDYFYANNSGTGGGGAIAFSGTNANLLAQSSTFAANTSINGGAFQTNGNYSLATFENTDFLDNTATALGGAIYVGPNSQFSVVNLNVTTGTARFSGNKAGTAGGASGTANSIEWDSTAGSAGANSGTLAITTAAGAVLDMLDPMAVSMTAYGSLDITKDGAGAWKLSGTSVFNRGANNPRALNFDVNAGALYLYGAGDPAAAAGGNGAGNLSFIGTGSNTFTVHAGAALAPGGGNTISLTGAAGSALTLAPGSILSYSLANALPGYGPGGATWLTLTAPTLAIATGGLANFSLNFSTWTTGSYNLLAATNGSNNLTAYITDQGQSLLGSITYVGGLPVDTPTIGINAAGQLWIAFSSTDTLSNAIIAWTGAADTSWYGLNWTGRAAGRFSQNDIVNLDGAATTGTTTLNLSAPATIGALFVSGNQSYTITGQAITTDTTAGTLKNTPANTGQLVLGAKATPDATAVDTVAFTGTLTLTNTSNTFTNGIDIRAGALVGNAANLATGAAAGIAIAPGATLTIDQPTAATYATPITGAGLLNKNGAGNLALSANSAAFTGTTNINAGTFRLTNTATLGGLINVNTAATLGGAGASGANGGGVATGSVAVHTGATLQIGSGAATAQTFNILGDLTLEDGAQLAYINSGNMLQVGGALALTGTSTFNFGTVTLTTSSSYSLIDVTGANPYAGVNLDWFNVNYGGAILDPAQYSLTADGGLLWLTFLSTPLGANNVLTWTNSTGDNLWHASANWTTAGVTKPFAQGDIVNLNDTASTSTSTLNLNLTTTATLAALYISGTTNYAISGPGALVTATGVGGLAAAPAATGKLVLGKTTDETAAAPALAAFTGTLDLTAQTGAANNFTAGIEINTGALLVATNAQLGISTLKSLSFTGNTTTDAGTGGAGGTLIVAPGGSLLFDGGSADQSLVTLANTTGAILLQPGATMTLQNMTTGFGAVTVTGTSAIALIAAPGAQFVIDHSTSTARGAGINVLPGATLALDGATITNGNAASGGAAISLGGNGNSPGYSAATISHALIANNTSNIGGAIYVGGPGNILTLASSTIANNTTTAGNANNGGGGAINFSGPNGVASTVNATFTDVLFQGNVSAGNNAPGGAISLSNFITDATLTLTRVLFASNTAASGNNSTGGGMAIFSTAATATLTDVSFIDNRAIGSGGGLYFNGATLAYNVATSATLSGNLSGATPAANGIYLGANVSALTIDAAPGAHLDMLDPMTVASTALAITKTGAGTWNLSGANTLGASSSANVNLTIAAGTLHLYRAGETSGALAATVGNLTIAGGSFTLAPGATLSAGGRNTLTTPILNLAPDSILALDLNGAVSGTAGAAILTLNAPVLNAADWTQTLDLLNLDTLAPATDTLYNLITLAGSGAFADPASFNLLDDLPTGFDLLLTPDSKTLELFYSPAAVINNVITWTGAAGTAGGAGGGLWRATNWSANGATSNSNRGDIANLADANPAATGDTTININPAGGALVAGLYVSGTENYTITGTTITASATAGLLAGSNAATGKLILGAIAANDATAITPLDYTGTLTLANTSNNFAGGIDIITGALVGNAATLGSGTAGITIADAASLTFDQPANATYAAPVTGAGTLVKTGSGALTLAASTAGFTGDTDILTGALLLANAASTGAIHVATGATLGAAGSAGAVTLDTGATLQIGLVGSTTQTLALATLALADGDTLDYASYSNTLHVTNLANAAPAGSTTINIDSIQTGVYNLGNLATLAGSQLTVAGALLAPDARQSATIAANGNDLLLTASVDISRILTWTGSANNGTWALTGADWTDHNTTNPTNVFGNGDQVLFDDLGAANPDITVAPSGVTVSDMFVNGTTNYTMTGGAITTDAASVYSGSILTAADTTGKLHKAGAGALTLSNAAVNNFRGGIELTGGALDITSTTTTTAAVTAAADTTLQMTGGLLLAGTLAPAPGSTLTGAGTIRFDNLVLTTTAPANAAPAANANAAPAAAPTLKSQISNLESLTTANSPTANIAAGDILILSGSASGNGGILKTGDGELRFTNAALGNTGLTQIDAGAIRFTTAGGSAAFTGTGAGTLTPAATIETVLVNAGGTLSFGPNNTAAVNDANARDWTGVTILNDSAGVVTGANDIVHVGPGAFNALLTSGLIVAINAGDTGATVLANLGNNFAGYVRADTGVLQITDINQIGGPGSANTTKISLNGGVVEFSSPTGAMNIAGDIQTRATTGAILVDDGVAVTASRITAATGATGANSTLIKAGSGTFTNNGAMSTAALVVDQGRWIGLASGAATPATNTGAGYYAPVTINDGATLELSIPATGNAGATLGLVGGAPFSPTASGTINNAIMGAGTLEIDAGHLVLASPRSDIANVTINNNNGADTAVALQGASFAPNGSITVDNALLALAADQMTAGKVVLKNGARMGFVAISGTVPLPMPGFSSTQVIYDPMGPGRTATLASLTADGAAADLYFNTNVARGNADHLAIATPVSGTFNIHITNFTATSTLFTTTPAGIVATPVTLAINPQSTMELIHSPLTTTGTFILADDSRVFDAGVYKYTVNDITAGNSYSIAITGSGALSNAADIINNAAAALPASWFSELENVTQRMGELHSDNRDPAKGGLAAWMRGNIEKLNYNNKVTAGAGSGFDEIHVSGAAGVDYKTGDDTQAVYLGAYAGYGQSTRDRTTVASDVTSDSSFGGVYVTAVAKSGWYVDTTAKFNRFKNSFTALAASTGERATARYDNWAIGASIEAGKYCELPYDWFVEPQAQCAFTMISGATYATSSGMTVQLLPGSVTRARAGLRAGRPIVTGKYGTLNVYLKAYYGYQWTTDGQVSIAPAGGQSYRTFSPAIKGTALEGGAGLSWLLGTSTQIYFDYTTTQADYYIKPYGLNLGVRHMW